MRHGSTEINGLVSYVALHTAVQMLHLTFTAAHKKEMRALEPGFHKRTEEGPLQM